MGIKHSVTKKTGDKGYASEWNADHIIDSNVDFSKYQAKNFVIENLDTPPADPVEGQIYYDTTEKTLKIYNGTEWITPGGAPTIEKTQVEATNEVTLAGIGGGTMPDMSVTHNSKTGKVLVLFTCWIQSRDDTGFSIFLRKDGSMISATQRGEDWNAGDGKKFSCIAIHYLDTSAGNNTWDIQWVNLASGTTLHAFYRTLTIIDIL